MRTVQYAEYGPPGVLRIVEEPEPHAGPGEIRIAVRASSVSPGEVRSRSGAMREVLPAVFPVRTGYDAAGVVDELGEGVTGTRVGDEVFGATAMTARGSNADHVNLAMWARRPAGWTWEEAAGATGAVETSFRVLDRLAVGAGHTVLVHGAAGGTGSVAVQLAAARGATVLGTASEHNHGFLRSLGAEPTTYGPGLAERIRALAPSGVDAVFDCAGGVLPDLVAIAGDPARVVTVADITAAAHGVHMSHTAPGASVGPPDPPAAHGLAIAVELAEQGRLRIPVAGAFPLAEVAAAHALSEGGHARGKIVLLH
ncbi:NADP-dependent oxidoreductase [Streptomyces sp. HNM0575]|uniref:NADP-dependent oxidoreductase n=1 Tax=Streptomyces sp. HNM0575 TaxID=2716338 RepID=UPI00145D0CD7|nr:NADP-dependent oxidoreductase [Streptomyces sp. HNM0575]NLU74037.1 NADP-dependent oxidoreductase [Streptomyces sp. HNM0575]